MKTRPLTLIISFSVLCVIWLCILHGANSFKARGQSLPPSEIEVTAFFNQKLSDTAFVTAVLQYLDAGEVADATELLRVRQSSDILNINDLLSSLPEKSSNTAAKLFGRIARDRTNLKVVYTGKLGQIDTNAEAEVKAILKRYR